MQRTSKSHGPHTGARAGHTFLAHRRPQQATHAWGYMQPWAVHGRHTMPAAPRRSNEPGTKQPRASVPPWPPAFASSRAPPPPPPPPSAWLRRVRRAGTHSPGPAATPTICNDYNYNVNPAAATAFQGGSGGFIAGAAGDTSRAQYDCPAMADMPGTVSHKPHSAHAHKTHKALKFPHHRTAVPIDCRTARTHSLPLPHGP